ncbi:Box C/D snoRNA protein 1 [Madurella mycetomatis]|uniref:Box C/D snoRNA protein 1 n=1 Tax=Madurella mycetomatis TaxID=100816 RepID=A0A175WES6_9PEZI|nr:Box C/D snoRNA protein 1 [Madurella mycetomatis]
MSDTVLSTLCSICHAQAPKYKCPGCGARTCSVACVQKHKTRADCDGVRNPRAFMPLSQLRTDAGIDHDFNFISSIERARQRSEKDLVEIRQLLTERELRPANEEKQFHKIWHGDELHHIPVQSRSHTNNGRTREGPAFIDGFDKHVRRRLRFLDIEAITMPKGMARQRENKTAWNRRTQSINWQVEWLVYSAPRLGFPARDQQQPLRILYKSLEGKPLNCALASTLEWHRGQLDRQTREQLQFPQYDAANDTDNEPDPSETSTLSKKCKAYHHHNNKKHPPPPQTQDPMTSAWPSASYTTQSPFLSGSRGTWNQTTTTASLPTTLEEDLAAWRFFLLQAGRLAPSTNTHANTNTKAKALIPLASTETLTAALAGRTVIEFPTVYALPPRPEDLPEGFVLDSGERRAALRERGAGGEARGSEREASASGNRSGNGKRLGRTGFGRTAKRVRFERGNQSVREAAEEAEDGEVNSDGYEVVCGVDGAVGAEEIDIDPDADVNVDGEDGTDSSGRDGSIGQGPGRKCGKPRGGLVDYGSSDESD